jgi:2-keto-4-pentenoate hydratase/2-oxohepta-3-ene-1,7-dioic acid hydratase in catechol pathway
MEFFQTSEGAARRNGDQLELLDGVSDLHAEIVAGRLDALRSAPSSSSVAFADAVLLSPVRPGRLIQVGLNYQSHLDETGMTAPETPMFAVTDVTNQVSAPGATITMPADDPDTVDYECEIGLVIGATAENVSAADAWKYIAGVVAVNDVSARTLQRAGFATRNFAAGKMLEGFKPIGPGIISADEASAGPIPIRLAVNGDVRQQATSDEMVFGISSLIEILSAAMVLHPGDVIMTGSPAGVGFLSGNLLKPGDVTQIWLGDMPPLVNHFAAAE